MLGSVSQSRFIACLDIGRCTPFGGREITDFWNTVHFSLRWPFLQGYLSRNFNNKSGMVLMLN